jgi:hypothetical protein
MEPVYDRYENSDDLAWYDLQFKPTRFEVWRNGQKIESGRTTSPEPISLKLETNSQGILGVNQIRVTHTEPQLYDFSRYENWFDIHGTQGNRQILTTVPTETNAKCVGMVAMQHRWPHSRYSYQFKPNEPFTCSLFTVKGQLVKLTFSLDNPETLVEFYKD